MALKVKLKKKGLGAQVSAAIEKEKSKNKGKSKEKPAKEAAEKKDALVKFGGETFPPIPAEEKEKIAVDEDQELRQMAGAVNKMSVRMMIILRNSKVYDLWKLLKDKNGKSFKDSPAKVDASGKRHSARTGWENWVADAMPQARSTGFFLVKQAELLLPVIPKAELEEISARNRQLLTKVPKLKFSKPDDPIRVAAKGSERGLREAIKNHSPESHVDTQSSVKLDDSAKDVCSDAIQDSMILNDCKTEGEGLEIICLDYRSAMCADERFQGMSNQEAAAALRKQRESDPELQAAG